jgi:proteasome beta subunit
MRGYPAREDAPDKRIKTGTTVLALRFKNGILLLGDRKTSSGYSGILSQESVKIDRISPTTAICCCGWVASKQFIKRELVEENRSFYDTFDFFLSVGGQANFLSQILSYHWMYFGCGVLDVGSILAGYDQDGSFHIYHISDDGSYIAFDKYFADGSGGNEAITVLDLKWKENLTFRRALRVAIEAVCQSGSRDSGTSDIRIATPNAAIITSCGFAFVDEELIKKVCEDVIEKRHGVQ